MLAKRAAPCRAPSPRRPRFQAGGTESRPRTGGGPVAGSGSNAEGMRRGVRAIGFHFMAPLRGAFENVPSTVAWLKNPWSKTIRYGRGEDGTEAQGSETSRNGWGASSTSRPLVKLGAIRMKPGMKTRLCGQSSTKRMMDSDEGGFSSSPLIRSESFSTTGRSCQRRSRCEGPTRSGLRASSEVRILLQGARKGKDPARGALSEMWWAQQDSRPALRAVRSFGRSAPSHARWQKAHAFCSVSRPHRFESWGVHRKGPRCRGPDGFEVGPAGFEPATQGL